MEKKKKVFFIGIKGVGMTGLALLFRDAGYAVAGSDVGEEFATDAILSENGIRVYEGFATNSLREFFLSREGFVIVTSAHKGFENPQAIYAKSMGLPVFSYGQALGQAMDGQLPKRNTIKGISIAGSHGKTTISAMFATYLSLLRRDPSYVVGTSEFFPLRYPGHFGEGEYFVAEADEYLSESTHDRRAKFLYQHPYAAVVNNIDFDHPDFYDSIEKLVDAFAEFVSNIKSDGLLILNGDDPHANTMRNAASGRTIITYGVDSKNDFVLTRFSQLERQSVFEVESKGVNLGEFSLAIPGIHNAKNSLAAVAFLTEIGVSLRDIQKVLYLFGGAARRIEYLGATRHGAVLLDDYAHHPAEIRATLRTVKQMYPGKKIICIFQPHTYSRTRALWEAFSTAFRDASAVIFLPTFASREEKDEEADQELLTSLATTHPSALFLKNADSVIEYVNSISPDDSCVILTMGAGDVYKINSKLKTQNSKFT